MNISSVNQSGSEPIQYPVRPMGRVALFVLTLLASLRGAQSSSFLRGNGCEELLNRVNNYGSTLAERFGDDIVVKDSTPYIQIKDGMPNEQDGQGHSDLFKSVKTDYEKELKVYLKYCSN